MEKTYLICLAVAIIGGLMLSRLTKLLNLPAVTAYLVAGLILGPFCIGALKIPGIGKTLPYIGGLPLGKTKKEKQEFNNAVDKRLAQKNSLSHCR